MVAIPRYILLLMATTLISYIAGLIMGMNKSSRVKTACLAISIIGSLGLLVVFKYSMFLNYSTKMICAFFGMPYTIPAFSILLPVGISFYTFQSLSYSIDVYRGQRKPETHLGIYAVYISFFPQLVAGPIERSTTLLPQFHKKSEFDYNRIVMGLQLMLWGVFKKIAIADRLSVVVNQVYGDPTQYHGIALIIATYFFTIQIYCDFSGYSDIAIGAAQVIGFDLMQNFRRPYFAQSIREFWQRWHISLSTWFRDYFYFPLGGNRVSRMRRVINILAVFMLSGLWHGANWSFFIWGALHGGFLSTFQLA